MRGYIREIVAKQARDLFHEPDAETVLTWWVANEGRKPVVVVGAGFTRNAVYKATGEPVRAADAPLWGEVSEAFASDLRIENAAGIDPLALAELHRDGLGERRFFDMLRDLLPDDALAAGEAHEALFNFDLEAIVTTNFLDTLLDRKPECVPIFDDRDLARRIDKPRQIEVLYLHGHRSSPSTWVASRSQYEDLPHKIPMIFTRVRQLLSQHPVITVGFSLTDPDFHQVYRQISLDMQVTNPFGLALLGPSNDGERTSEQESAQRRHWERLGLRIARFKGWDGFGEKIARFFSMTNPIEVEELKDIVGEPKRPFTKRVSLARSAFEDPNVTRYVHTHRGWENAVWRVCIEREFESGEHEEVKEKIRQCRDARWSPSARDEVRISIGGLGPSQVPNKEPRFKARCFEGRIRKEWRLAWLVDQWIETRKPSAERLAAWLSYRVEHEHWDQRERYDGDVDIDIAELLGAIWRTIDERADIAGGHPHRKEALRQLHIAHRFLTRYKADAQANRVEEDIKALGGSLEAPEKKPPERARMKIAFQRMMNGKYEEAAREYDGALEEATRTDDSLLKWLAASGRHDAYWRAANKRRDETRETESDHDRWREKEYTRAKKKYANLPDVKQWMEEADRRISDLRKKTIEKQIEAARDRQFERRGMSFSDAPHFAWRAFRDLESRDAPPGLQESYLRPLLDYDGFDAHESLEYRLRFGLAKTKEWVKERLGEREDSISDAYKRDRALVDAWHRIWSADDTTHTALVACIETMDPLLDVLSVDDAPLPLKLLQKAMNLPGIVQNHRGSHAIGDDLAQAWRDYACTLRNEESYQAFQRFATDTTNQVIIQDEIARHMGELPWYAWLILGSASADEIVQWLYKRIGQGQRGTQGLGNALLNVVGNADDVAAGLSAESWNLVARWCASALEQGGQEEQEPHSVDWIGPVLNLITIRAKRRGERERDDTWKQVEEKAYDLLHAAWRAVVSGRTEKLNASLATSILWCLAIIMEGRGDARWDAFAEEAWKTVVKEWAPLRRFIDKNPFWLPKLGWFLATIIEQNFKNHRDDAGAKLLEIWSLSSSVHHAVPRILDEKLWSADGWSKVIDKLREGLGGARGQFSASWRMAISSLLRQTLLHRASRGRASLSDIDFLVDHVALLVANEEAIVANHAAYTVTFCAEICTDEVRVQHRVALLERTLESMASDPRLAVRQAAAYAGGRLPRTAKSKRIRDCADRIHQQLKSEPYLLLRRQAELGAAEGNAHLRRSGEPPTPGNPSAPVTSLPHRPPPKKQAAKAPRGDAHAKRSRRRGPRA